MIPFNKPYFSGKETEYIKKAIEFGKISGNGKFTQKCQAFFEKRYGIKKALLTTSCTDALEMAAILLDIKEGDEVIMPSYTFVSTANAFVLRGAKIVFADSCANHPNIDVEKIEELITKNTKVIVPVHYAGCACDMAKIMMLAQKYNLYVVEDAAQAIEAKYKNQYLGTLGDLAAFSFHETKNIIAGEGGLLAINNEKFLKRAEIIWEKGTNRTAFFRGEVDKYGWVDIGSSFLPSELTAAYLWAQLEAIEKIQEKRMMLWQRYFQNLKKINDKNKLVLPYIRDCINDNAHIFYLVCQDKLQRDSLLTFLKEDQVHVVTHYISLHKSKFFKDKHDGRKLENSDKFTECLLRLPLFYELGFDEIDLICEKIEKWLKES